MENLNKEEKMFVLQCLADDIDVTAYIDLEDSDDEGQILLAASQMFKSERNCIKNYFELVVPTYNDIEFTTHFRIKKSVFESISLKYESSEAYKKLGKVKKVSPRKSTAVFLWFAGHEACSFRDLADRFDLSISSVSRIITRLTKFLSKLSPNVITWPNEEEKRKTSEFFKRKAGFSGVIGCIDGTHITIDPPAISKDEYVDRKGNVSLIMQAICNEQKKFIDVFIGFPGSSHDSWVFQNSPLYEVLSSDCGDYYLLGDSAYPCSSHLVTPYRDNGRLINEQKRFNVKLSSCRVVIEHSFGILKQRFRQLYYCKLKGIQKLCHFVRACCVLHNIADEDDLHFAMEVNEADQNVHTEYVQLGGTSRGTNVRDAICRELQ